jgi:hypothetical protein
MRFIIPAVAAVLALGLAAPTPSVAQGKQKGSLQDSYNSCVTLAKQRGWTVGDLESNRAGVRNFVVRCMQGKGARAQKR